MALQSKKDFSTIVVTGASTGIGATCALRLDELGFKVFAGIRKAADGQQLAERASPHLVPLELDVTKPRQISAAAERVAEAVGEQGLLGLVNNAGIVVAGPLEHLSIPALREQFEVNVVGQIAVTQAFLPLLRAGGGRIVNMGSVSGRFASPFLGPYAASKFALEALTDALRVELRPWGIHVSLIEPGAVATPIWEKSERSAESMQETFSEEAEAHYGEALEKMRAVVTRLAQRAASPEEVAAAVVHALTARRPRTRYIIGAGARVQVQAAAWLPDRVRDGLIVRVIGLK
jgi:NAD(P)-dependent dehydrogenase (short-subunit alcohol dehydrogenase family)